MSLLRPSLAVLVALAAALALVPVSAAQAPARAHAEARVAAGDLGTAGRAVADGDARQAVPAGAGEAGLEVAAGQASARASRAGGDGFAQAAARAHGVVLLGGLVTAERVRRRATATAAGVAYDGAVAGLTVGEETIGSVIGPARYALEGAVVTVNTGGAGLTLELTADRDGFAAGTTVAIAEVSAEAGDGADPTVSPTPTPLATPAPVPTPAATPTPEAAPPGPTARERAAARGRRDARRLARGEFAFPVYGEATFSDEFGAFRALTGSHQGNDVFAPFGAPVLAVADGTLERVGTLPISGNRLWLRTDRGDTFFYAHLSAFAPDAVDGRRVRAGALLGFVGNTGDAEPTPPHVHFEVHPGDRRAIDPYRILLAWRADGLVPAGGWVARYGADTAARPGALVEVRDFIAGE